MRVLQEDTMEGPWYRENLGRSLGSHNAAELVGSICHNDVCRQESPHLLAISCTNAGSSSLAYNRVIHPALTRPLRETKVQFVVEDTWPFHERASGQNGRLNRLGMDITMEVGALLSNHPRRKNKALLPELPSSTLVPAIIWRIIHATQKKHLATAIKLKKNKYRGSFPATYSLLPLAISSSGEADSDVRTLIKEPAIRQLDHTSEIDARSPSIWRKERK